MPPNPRLAHLSNRSLRRAHARTERRFNHAREIDFDPQRGVNSARHMRHGKRLGLLMREMGFRVVPTHKWTLPFHDIIRELTRVHFSLIRRSDAE